MCLEHLAEAGFIVSTDYSGKQSPEFVMLFLEAAWRQAGFKIPSQLWRFYRACDKAAICQKIMALNGISEHIFVDISDRLPPEQLQIIENLEPAKGSVPDAALAGYTRMQEHLLANLDICFPEDSVAPCLKHPGRRCRLSEAPDAQCRSGGRCAPLSLHVAGAMCTPWSAMGSGRGLGDPATRAWHIWSCERVSKQEDIIFLEEADIFPSELFADLVIKTHDCKVIVFGPEMLGWPIRRNRTLMWCLNLSKLVWVGPSQTELQQDFQSIFRASRVVTGDIFAAIDTEHNQRVQLQDMARARKSFLRPDFDTATLDISQLLGPSARSRYQKYREEFTRKLQQAFASDRCFVASLFDRPTLFCIFVLFSCCQGPVDGYIADLSQDPSYRNRSSNILCTRMKNTMCYSFSKRHLFTASEMCVAHGWPAVASCAKPGFQAPAWMSNHGLLGISTAQLRSLTGNAMHLACIGAWLAYCMCHTVRCDLINGCSDHIPSLTLSVSPIKLQTHEPSSLSSSGVRRTASGSFAAEQA